MKPGFDAERSNSRPILTKDSNGSVLIRPSVTLALERLPAWLYLGVRVGRLEDWQADRTCGQHESDDGRRQTSQRERRTAMAIFERLTYILAKYAGSRTGQ